MHGIEFAPLFLQLLFTFLSVSTLHFIGSCVTWMPQKHFENSGTVSKNNNCRVFYTLLFGLVLTVGIYACILSAGKTIFTLLLASLAILFFNKTLVIRFQSPIITLKKCADFFVLSTLFVILFNLLPESEFKQKDSYFYLKISESLSLSGQENANHYYNLLSADFHGIESYHYLELWLNNALMQLFTPIIPGIQVFRIVTFSLLTIIFCYGVLYLFELLNERSPRFLEKLACISFVFFLPDIFYFLPEKIQHYLVFNFENNYMERPNLRLVYLFFIPVVAHLLKPGNSLFIFFFLACFATINPTITVLLFPAVVISRLWSRHDSPFTNQQVLYFSAFTIVLIFFFVVFRNTQIPPMYQFSWEGLRMFYERSWKYVILTTVSSLVYCALILAAFAFVFKQEWNRVKPHRPLLVFMFVFIVSGIMLARVGDFLDNLYQIAYNSFVATTILIFLLFLKAISKTKKRAILVLAINLAGFILFRLNSQDHKNIFDADNDLYHSGKNYSRAYMQSVSDYFLNHKNSYGAWMADSIYYRDLYYSARNPNVYHLPITYVISDKHKNIDFCLSEKKAILHHPENRFNNNRYLLNALERSIFHRSDTAEAHPIAVTRFIHAIGIDYLILSPGMNLNTFPKLNVERMVRDENTGEQFIILK